MDLDKLLKSFEATESHTKVASAPVAGQAESDALAAALEKVAGRQVPVAEQDNPLNGLMKMATELAGTERDREITVAALCGSAFADAAVAKFAAYDAQAQKLGAHLLHKEAGAAGLYTEEDMHKYAEQAVMHALQKLAEGEEELAAQALAAADAGGDEGDLAAELPPEVQQAIAEASPEELQEAMDILEAAAQEEEAAAAGGGAVDPEALAAMNDQEKVSAAYNEGWNSAVSEVYNAAQREFFKGAAEAEILVNHYRQMQR